MRRREDGQRTLSGFQDLQPIAGSKIDGIRIGRSAESILLPRTRRIAPDQPGIVADREALQAGFVDIRNGRFFGLRNRLLAQQIRSFVGSKSQIAREDAERQAVEGETDPVAI